MGGWWSRCWRGDDRLGRSVICFLERRRSVHGGSGRNLLFRTVQKANGTLHWWGRTAYLWWT
jgi:hypothetical protein